MRSSTIQIDFFSDNIDNTIHITNRVSITDYNNMDLPVEIWYQIILNSRRSDLINIKRTCVLFQQIVNSKQVRDKFRVVIAAGAYHSMALTESGVVCWGYNFYGQCDVPNGL